VEIFFVLWIVCPILSYVIGSMRGCALLGCLVGVFLGPLGVLIACLLPEQEVRSTTRRVPIGFPLDICGVRGPDYPNELPSGVESRPSRPNGGDTLDFLR